MKSELELLFLKDAFGHIDFFEKMRMELKQEDLFILFRQLKIESAEAGQTVFNLGDWGDKFYVIIKGAVYILLKKSNEVAKESEKPQRQAPRVRTRTMSRTESLKAEDAEGGVKNESESVTGTSLMEFSDDMHDEDKLKIIKNDFPGFFLGRVMETGAAFGEIALQNKTQRTATVVCKNNTVFGVLTREDYNRLLYWVYKKRDEENLNFLKTFNLFTHLANSKLNEIYLQLEKKIFQKNHVFYREGQPADNIYFIKSGEVELPEVSQNKKKGERFDSPKKFLHQLFVHNNEQTKKKVKYALLQMGHYFGMEELFTRSDRINTATVASLSCDVFVMSHQVFRKLVTDRDLIRIAKENIEQRAVLAQNMSSNITKVDGLFIRDSNDSSSKNSPILKTKANTLSNSTSFTKELDAKSTDTLALKEKLMTKVNGHISSFYIRDLPESDKSQPRLSLLDNLNRGPNSKTNLSISPERKSIQTIQMLPEEGRDSPNKHRRTSMLIISSIENLSSEFDLDKNHKTLPKLPSKFHQSSIIGSQLDLHPSKEPEEFLTSFMIRSSTKPKTLGSTEILSSSFTKYASQPHFSRGTKNSVSNQSIPKLQTESSPDIIRHSNIRHYRSLCRTLKLDKIFKPKDHIDNSLTDVNLKSANYSVNQELSMAISSFKVKDLNESFSPSFHNESFSKEERNSRMKRKLKTVII